MADDKTYDHVMDLAGHPVRFARPAQGQVESLIRIGYALRTMGDDVAQDYWSKQLHRMGTLLDSLIHPDDETLVDNLYLTGKIEHATLIRAVMSTLEKEAEQSEDAAIAKAKAKKSNPARVRRD